MEEPGLAAKSTPSFAKHPPPPVGGRVSDREPNHQQRVYVIASPPHASLSALARSAIFNSSEGPASSCSSNMALPSSYRTVHGHDHGMLAPPQKTVVQRALGTEVGRGLHALPVNAGGIGRALSDTPLNTAPPSPQILPRSGSSTPGKSRATTLDIPGLTKSKVSPDGTIAQRDVGSKLVIVMVGLPARGKSYITKKLARYLNWMQHSTLIFNVGQRRRTFHAETSAAASGQSPRAARQQSIVSELRASVIELSETSGTTTRPDTQHDVLPPPVLPPATILVNGKVPEQEESNPTRNQSPMTDRTTTPSGYQAGDTIPNGTSVTRGKEDEQSDDPSKLINQPAEFFDPHNQEALQIREQVALATLDELLDYILEQNGSVGILDATNSTLERRIAIMDRIRARAGPELNVLFLESQCLDENLLQTNMHLKLSGPDYRGKDPKVALEDFRRRVRLYEESYVPLGKYEEEHNIPYLQVIDVSRKLVSHQVNGFLSSQVVYYLLNFNLSPRQIWVTRHGESVDDVQGKIGGNAHLSENGVNYARALARFMDNQRIQWYDYQRRKSQSIHFPPLPGDSTPPNPQYASQFASTPNFCVWTSMLQRAQETAQFFDDEVYDVKEMRMLDEMNVGLMDGMTYAEIIEKFSDDYERRKREKLQYRFPGTGGEGYLDLINRLKAVIVEIERMTDHVLLVTHRSVARVLLSYFLGLKREDLTDLDIPLGVVYCVEPKTYGVEFKMYRYDPQTDDFHIWSNDNLHSPAPR